MSLSTVPVTLIDLVRSPSSLSVAVTPASKSSSVPWTIDLSVAVISGGLFATVDLRIVKTTVGSLPKVQP